MTRPTVQTGLDQIVHDADERRRLEKADIGMIVNPASVTSDLEHAIDAFLERDLEIERLFAPEHGVRGEAQEMEAVDQTRDPISGLPVVSLYGDSIESLQPEPGQLDDLDVLIADLQDVGARYYTYASTIGYVMEICGEVGVDVWVLDRPNPINGTALEGNVVQEGWHSFVGTQPIANRHGMTMGELTRYFVEYGGWECNLRVVEMEGWERSMWFDETGLPWVMPSPNLTTPQTATVYPGQCLLEGTNLSEGRGTTRPFEIFGAPWIDAPRFKAKLDSFDLPGVGFRSTSFRPMFQTYAGESCRGAQIHVRDREAYDSLATGLAVLSAAYTCFTDDFEWQDDIYEFVDDRLAIDLLLGDADVRDAIETETQPVDLAREMRQSRDDFEEKREACLLYE